MSAEKDMIDSLRQAGMRLTPQRTEICRILAHRDDHPTAQQVASSIQERFPNVSLTTVYGTLDALVKLGAIRSLGNVGDERVHFEPNTEPHVNLACMSCHRIVDMPSEHVKELESEVQERIGSKVLSGRVVYYTECLESNDKHQCPFYQAMQKKEQKDGE
jgi:Fur family peroxide stress response transcriptional regulator